MVWEGVRREAPSYPDPRSSDRGKSTAVGSSLRSGRQIRRTEPVARYAGLDIGNATKPPPEGGGYTLAPPSAAVKSRNFSHALSEAKELKMRSFRP